MLLDITQLVDQVYGVTPFHVQVGPVKICLHSLKDLN